MITRFGSLYGLLIAVAIHVVVLRIPVQFELLAKAPEKAIGVEFLDRPIVFTHSSRDTDHSDAKARYLSNQTNRVARETKSGVSGRFGDGAYAFGSGASELFSISQTPDLLPDDLPVGSETLLSTDRYRYAGFFHRVSDTIYQPWVNRIEQARSLILENLHGSDHFITRVSVTLDQNGEVFGVQLLGECGVPEIDEAPRKAFWDVARFPNPPRELFKETAFIRLQYEFHLKFKSNLFEILPWTV